MSDVNAIVFNPEHTVGKTHFIQATSYAYGKDSLTVTERDLPSRTDINLDKSIVPAWFKLVEQETNGARSQDGLNALRREAGLVMLNRLLIDTNGELAKQGTRPSFFYTSGQVLSGHIKTAIRDNTVVTNAVDAIYAHYYNNLEGMTPAKARQATADAILDGQFDKQLGALSVGLTRNILSHRHQERANSNNRNSDIAATARVMQALGKDHVYMTYTGHIRDLDMPYAARLLSRPAFEGIKAMQPAPQVAA